MEGVLTMSVYKAGLAPPMWPITILTAKTGLHVMTGGASDVDWGKF
jgi:hypothetical protein